MRELHSDTTNPLRVIIQHVYNGPERAGHYAVLMLKRTGEPVMQSRVPSLHDLIERFMSAGIMLDNSKWHAMTGRHTEVVFADTLTLDNRQLNDLSKYCNR